MHALRGLLFIGLFSLVTIASRPTMAYEIIGAGTKGLLGGDLTDPNDTLKPNEDCGGGTEEALRPKNATWLKMKCFPANGPGEIGHQQHPYQSWVGTPASAIVWNMLDEDKKWYVGFKDGGYGGPTNEKPYFLAIQLKAPHILTHFTVATSADKPLRDPRTWALQGSNTGDDNDWTDIYRCNANDRAASPFREYPRGEVVLFSSFTSASLAEAISAENAKRVAAKLNGKELAKADYVRPEKAYSWFRIAVYSCFNGNTLDVPDPSNPPGFALGQLELFSPDSGQPASSADLTAQDGVKKPVAKTVAPVEPTTVDPAVLAGLPAPGTGALRRTLPLDGEWDIAQGDLNSPPADFKHKIAVPGLIDMAVPGIGEGAQAYWYRRKFAVTGPLESVAFIKVHKAMFGTKVVLNGTPLGEHVPNFTPGYFDAKPALREGENELLIRIGGGPAHQASFVQWGYDAEKKRYIPGIYDSVELTLCGPQRILRIQAVPHVESKAVSVHAWMPPAGDDKGARVHYTIREASTKKVVAEGDCVVSGAKDAVRTGMATMRLDGCRLWSPEDPFLYEIEARSESDVIGARFGMRSLTFDQASGHAVLNGKPYFLRGTNVTLYRFFEDPQRGSKPWNEDWVRKLFTSFRDVHWNSLRFSICFPPEKWYDIADELGFLVQDEFPIWQMYPKPGQFDEENLVQDYTEWMQERWNHPCVVVWDACNETPAPETGKAIRRVRKLDYSDRVWDNGFSSADQLGDIFESHPYHYKDTEFKPQYLGRLSKNPKGNAYSNKDKNPVIINEYGWLWLNRDGRPTTLTAEVYGKLMPGASPAQLQALHAKLLAQETEFWRHSREAAAVMEFCGLGYSRPDGQTSDHWVDIDKLTWEPEFYKYVKDSFAPVGAMVEAYEVEYLAGAAQDFPVSVINDLGEAWEGTVRLRVTKAGESLAAIEEVKPCKVEAGGKTIVTFKITVPAEQANYLLDAALIRGSETPVRSYREFRSAATVAPR